MASRRSPTPSGGATFEAKLGVGLAREFLSPHPLGFHYSCFAVARLQFALLQCGRKTGTGHSSVITCCYSAHGPWMRLARPQYRSATSILPFHVTFRLARAAISAHRAMSTPKTAASSNSRPCSTIRA
jgi:hypothetical protein